MKQTKGAYTKINSMIGMATLVLFLSSYVPLFVIIIVRQSLSNYEYLNWGGLDMDAFICMMKYFGMSIFCLILILFGLIGTTLTLNHVEEKMENGNNVRITEISSMNDEPLAYVATYIIPIMFEDYSNITDCITIVGIFYVVYRLYIRSKLILVNPLLSLKYSIYNIRFIDGEISRQGILISKDCCIKEDDFAKIYNVGYQLYFGYKR
jgi:hypothetical protein